MADSLSTKIFTFTHRSTLKMEWADEEGHAAAAQEPGYPTSDKDEDGRNG